LIAVKFTESFIPELASAYINSAFGRNWVKSVVVQQVGQANVNGTKLAALAVPLPPAEEQAEIFGALEIQLEAMRQQEAAIESGLRQAAAQRKNLLKVAFAGQLAPQDPNDEPASELLARIHEERRTRSIRGGKPSLMVRKAK
jgi:type I restriction enzyme S subunit